MKKLTLTISLLFFTSCSYIPSISKEEAINRLNQIKEKYKKLEEVESKFVILKERKKDKQILSTNHVAFDNKQEMLYVYDNDSTGLKQEWQFFDNENGQLVLWTYKNENNQKTKHKSIEEITGINYFKTCFLNLINGCLKEIDSEMNSEKISESYRAWWGKSINITIKHKNYNYKADIIKNEISSIIIEILDDSSNVEMVTTTRFDYDNFSTSKPSSSEYKEI